MHHPIRKTVMSMEALSSGAGLAIVSALLFGGWRPRSALTGALVSRNYLKNLV